MPLKRKIFIAGHTGMVGNSIYKILKKDTSINLITKSHRELDLRNQKDVLDFLTKEKPDEVILAAAKVGGIYANEKYPGEFIYDNLQIQNNVINGSHLTNVNKLLFLGSSCIYPKLANQPMKENYLLTGSLEPTNEPYAIAKIAGIKMCESYNRQYNRDYRAIMPTNLYGPGDNYHPLNSHVVPALIRKIHFGKINSLDIVSIWGTGNQKREFLFVEDMAKASIFIHNIEENLYKKKTLAQLSHINIGTGEDITIRNLAEKIKQIIEYKGKLRFDNSKPDGAPRKLLDTSLIKSLGWIHETNLEEGLKKSYEDFLKRETY